MKKTKNPAPTSTRLIGHVRSIPDNVEESRIIPIILSTGGEDRHGTVLNPDGWNLDNYRANPIVGYQHELSAGWMSDTTDVDRVIAKDTGITFEKTGDDALMIGNPEFEPKDLNELADKVFRKMIFGSISAASVGFRGVGKGQWVEDENGHEVFHFAGQELLEYSIVNIPSNPGATKRMSDEALGVINYALSELGSKFKRSRIEQMSVRQILDLLDGKDLEIKETNPEKVARMLEEIRSKDSEIDKLQRRNRFLQIKQ